MRLLKDASTSMTEEQLDRSSEPSRLLRPMYSVDSGTVPSTQRSDGRVPVYMCEGVWSDVAADVQRYSS